tara:strand:- start:570 stop:728 length:159 start_codon:yes stop_codon:yes gene_type:complete
LKEQKLTATDIRCLNVYEIMNRNQQQLYTDIKKIAVSLEKIVKILEKKWTER